MDQLGRAGEAMGEAEGQLGEGNADGAVDSQGRALEAMRRGAQNLAQSMQQQGMMGPGPNGQPGRLGPPRAQQETDPLGRPLARARLRRRHHGQGAGRDRRAARAPHSRRAAPPFRRELPPAARARIYRAAAAGFLIREHKTDDRRPTGDPSSVVRRQLSAVRDGAPSASFTALRTVPSENGLVMTSWISASRPWARSR